MLVSIFVLSIGLLSIAALVPVGKFQVDQGTKQDRTAAMGRMAYRDLKVHGYLDPSMWLNYRGQTYARGAVAPSPNNPPGHPLAWFDFDGLYNPPPTPPVSPSTPIAYGQSICIDPLLFSYQDRVGGLPFDNVDPTSPPGAGAPDLRLFSAFPFPVENDPHQDDDFDQVLYGDSLPPGFPLALPHGNPPRMTRVTLRTHGGSPARFDFSMAQRLFSLQDELVYDMPSDDALRPFWAPVMSNRVGGVQHPLRQQALSDYSYLVTITPASSELYNGHSPRMYTVSVVVIYKRDLGFTRDLFGATALPPGRREAPKERIVFCDFLSPGIGGGEVRLRLPVRQGTDANDDRTRPTRSDMPNVRPGQWILLCNRTNDDPPRSIFRWYRIVDVAGEGPEPFISMVVVVGLEYWYRDVTLAGPDWEIRSGIFPDVDPPTLLPPFTTPMTCYAAIIDGVVGVYEKTMQFAP